MRTGRNFLASAAATAFVFGSNFLLYPYILDRLGKEAYGGVWVPIVTLSAVAGLVDLGLNQAFLRFLSDRYAVDDRSGARHVVATGFWSYLGIGLVLLLAVAPTRETIVRWIGVPGPLQADAAFCLLIACVSLVLNGAVAPILSLQSATGRMDRSSMAMAASQVFGITVNIAVLESGGGVRALALVNIATVAFTTGIHSWMSRSLFSFGSLDPREFRTAVAASLLRYGANLQVSRLAQVLVFQVDRVFALRFFGTDSSAAYDLAARLVNAFRTLGGTFVLPLLPAFAGLSARGETSELARLYRTSTIRLVLLCGTLFSFCLGAGPLLAEIWIGDALRPDPSLLRWLALGYWVNISTGAVSSLVAAKGATWIDRNYGLFLAVAHVPATLAAIHLFGETGIAVATFASLTSGAALLLFLARGVLREVRSPGMVAIVALLSSGQLLLGALVGLAAERLGTGLGRGESAVLFVFLGCLALSGSAALAATAVRLRWLTYEELGIAGILSRLGASRRQS